MNRKVLIIFIGFILVGSFIYLQRATITGHLIERVAEQRIGQTLLSELNDGLHVLLCGAGGPLADPKRSGPCVAIIAGETIVIVDAGSGGSRQLARMQVPVGNIDTQFLTHFHSDHIDGLGEMAMMRWINAGNDAPLPVIGPIGTKNVVNGFNQAYSVDSAYRHQHHGEKIAPLSGAGMTAHEFQLPAEGEMVTVFEKGDLLVRALAVDHLPVDPAVAYRFDYKGRSALISGDTKKSTNLEDMANGVDLLVHEALAPNLVAIMNNAARKNGNAILEKVTEDIIDYHASPVEVAEIAEGAKVGHLLYYHVLPPLIAPGMEAAFLDGVDAAYDGTYTVGVDGTIISLAAYSDGIETGQLK